MTPLDLEVVAVMRNIFAKVRLGYPITEKELRASYEHLKAVRFIKETLPLKTALYGYPIDELLW
jgi:hypothetical protein